jgi:aspartate racemase
MLADGRHADPAVGKPEVDVLFDDEFDAQVRLASDHVAVRCAGRCLTYGDLDRRANQLAHHLVAAGVEPGATVGLCTHRSVDLVVAIVGILKAGGAYVPLDAATPGERAAFVLADAGARHLVTEQALAFSFKGLDVAQVLLDRDGPAISVRPCGELRDRVRAESLAYIMYTSGSTGVAKGVMITHANVGHFVRLAGATLEVTRHDVYLHSASVAYALSVRQLLLPLAYGATVVMATADDMRDPLALFRLIKSNRVSLVDVVPSVWRTWLHRLSDLPPEEAADLLANDLRRIVSVGEPLPGDLLHAWTRLAGRRAQLVNIFGQTETTGVVATFPIPPGEGPWEVVPIGRSIPGSRLYVVNPDLEPVPPGQEGELCVSSPCVARGYINRPDLTTAKFVANPFGDGCSPRLYRTGDTVRLREDGNLEFVGRRDTQVKIRGQRVELGEVESALRSHPSVRDCVALLQGLHPHDQCLTAFVVPAPGQVANPPALKACLRRRVPDYMLPASITIVDAIPLTPNGKVDRSALSGPIGHTSRTPGGSTMPRDHVEAKLLRIWAELTRRTDVRRDDDFFDLGGHSLMAVRLFARIERELGVRLPLASLFQASTVAGLADLVRRGEDEVTSWTPVVPIRADGARPPFFGVHAREGGVLFWRELVEHLPEDQPFYAVQPQGIDGVRPALNCIEEMARLYVGAVRRVQPHGPYYLGGFSLGGEIAFEMAQQLVRAGEQVALLVLIDTPNPTRAVRALERDDGGRIVPTAACRNASRLGALRARIRGHLVRMGGIGFPAQARYMANQLWVHVKRPAIYSLAAAVRRIRRRLPDSLLRAYLRTSHADALRRYLPAVYPGRLTLFRARQSEAANPIDSPLGWGPLAAGGLETYRLDGDHEAVLSSQASTIADRLVRCLEAARRRDSDASAS